MLNHLKLPHVEVEGSEADDVIASIATQALKSDNHVFTVSTDTDFYQLLCDRLEIIRLLPKQENSIIAEHDIEMQLGIPTEKYVLYKSLVGDKADNVKGVPKVGPIM